MRYLLFCVLALALTGCAGTLPLPPTPTSTATPQLIIQTVLVTVAPTEGPSSTPAPTQTARVVVVTATSQPTATETATLGTGTPATPFTGTPPTPGGSATAALPPGSPTATLPPDAGGGLFSNLTRSSDHFAVHCQPDAITFGVTTADTTIRDVILFYRLENQSSGGLSDWKYAGLMTPDGAGGFTTDFAASSVNPDLRSQKAWFDYQFVAINKSGLVAGRSAKIIKQITYTIECPG